MGMARVRRPVARRGDRLAARRPEREQESDEIYLVAAEARLRSRLATGCSTSSASSASATTGSSSGSRSSRRRSPAAGGRPRDARRARRAGGYARARRVHARPAHRGSGGAARDLLAVNVHKRRAHYTVGGCMVECSELQTDRGDALTICLESEDPALIIETLPRARAARASQRERAARAQGDGRVRREALRRHRRRHELGQVPRSRSVRRTAGGRSSTAPRSRDSARISMSPGGSATTRSRAPPRRSPG